MALFKQFVTQVEYYNIKSGQQVSKMLLTALEPKVNDYIQFFEVSDSTKHKTGEQCIVLVKDVSFEEQVTDFSCTYWVKFSR
jgi:hypothetical protein